MKLPAHWAGLPGKVISFYIVPLDPAYPDRSGRGTFRPNKLQKTHNYSERLNKVVIARSEATWQSREIASLRSQ